jgi:hypothetical protein
VDTSALPHQRLREYTIVIAAGVAAPAAVPSRSLHSFPSHLSLGRSLLPCAVLHRSLGAAFAENAVRLTVFSMIALSKSLCCSALSTVPTISCRDITTESKAAYLGSILGPACRKREPRSDSIKADASVKARIPDLQLLTAAGANQD